MEIQELLSIAVVGGLLSLLIETVSSSFRSRTITKFFTLLLSIIVAGAYVWVRSTPYFQTVIVVLGTASTVYGFFLNKK